MPANMRTVDANTPFAIGPAAEGLSNALSATSFGFFYVQDARAGAESNQHSRDEHAHWKPGREAKAHVWSHG
jgi:hypothetical protein